jgi:RNA 3'-terminal phosphate cyclase (ATP)
MASCDARGVVHIDGSVGEGGGQMLRSALGLSMVTGRAFRMTNIRSKRSRPGLLRQHATAVRAAAEVSGARVERGELGSTELSFVPGRVRNGSYDFAIGTAGSTSLVLHAILPALLFAEGESEVRLSGGTDAMSAPPADHLAQVYVPWLHAMGIEAELRVERRGYYPAGGGRIVLRVRGGTLTPFDRLARGPLRDMTITARLAGDVPSVVADRELAVVGARLGIERHQLRVERADSSGPGNTLQALLRFDAGCELLTEFGARDVKSERVANELANHVQRFLAADVPFYEHSADQLMLLMALAGGGAFTTVALTEHSTTHAQIIGAFLPLSVTGEVADESSRVTTVRIVSSAAGGLASVQRTQRA